MDVVYNIGQYINTLNSVLKEIKTRKNLLFVGCVKHARSLTNKIVQFLIITRGHFFAKTLITIYQKKDNTQKISLNLVLFYIRTVYLIKL